MKILPMLARLENALGCPNLTKQMVLVPKAQAPSLVSQDSVNLVVGYNASPQSQTALDLTLWIAHQTRLATRQAVTVQVVYVIDLNSAGQTSPVNSCTLMSSCALEINEGITERRIDPYSVGGESVTGLLQTNTALCGTATAIAELPEPAQAFHSSAVNSQLQQFEQADHILWQARHLANEWRGSLKTHLRFGNVAEELCEVAIAESATVMLLGCTSADDPLVQYLKLKTPCPILGIPTTS